MKVVTSIAIVLLSSGVTSQAQAGFCSSRTTEAYHSPKCDWGWVVHDPHRAGDVKIPHKPHYHTYSRWALGSRTYIFAYRDIDDKPDDMAVDIYLTDGLRYKLAGSVEHLGEMVTEVFTARMTGSTVPDIVFRENCGALQCIVVLRFSDRTAAEVFRYGASRIRILLQPNTAIEATSEVSNLVEQFVWDPASAKFVKSLPISR